MSQLADGIASHFDRLPPHSLDAEMAVLASIAIDREAYFETKPLLSRDVWFTADHQVIFDVLSELYDAGKAVDALILRESLIARDLLEEIGGNAYLVQLIGSVPSAAHARHYAAIVVEKHKLRQLIALSNDIQRECYAPRRDEHADEVALKAEQLAARIRETGSADTIRTVGELADQVIEEKSQKINRRRLTGLVELDDLCGGLPIGCHTLVAGRAGMGKSLLCKAIIGRMADGADGTPCGIISVEESGTKIASNYLSAASGVENSHLVYNRLNSDEWRRLMEALPRVAAKRIVIDDAQQKLSSIQAVARQMKRKHGCKVIMVDHLHLIDAESADMNREQEISRISGGLKRLWKELDVCGVVAAQLNRGSGGDGYDEPPELRHLRGSGSLEQDGDMILQLHRPDYYNWKKHGNEFAPDHQLKIYVNKNKDGPVGYVTVYFDGDHQDVRDWQASGELPYEP
jgi:replicative DNA helicase